MSYAPQACALPLCYNRCPNLCDFINFEMKRITIVFTTLTVTALWCFSGLKGTLVLGAEIKYVASPSDCKVSQVPLLILVHSAPANLDKRNTLRESWTSNDPSFKTVFVVGHSLNETLEKQVLEESQLFNDILVGLMELRILNVASIMFVYRSYWIFIYTHKYTFTGIVYDN